jgi:DHA2 family multidrug resistance protein
MGAVARAYQSFGYAFMFVPVTQLAYSYLPKNKNNKGSSLMNLCRNWGASFGIAFVTTMLERRTQYHQSVLVSHLTSADGAVQQFVKQASRYC